MSYKEFPPLQAPVTYNLDSILKKVQEATRTTPANSRYETNNATKRAPLQGRPLDGEAMNALPVQSFERPLPPCVWE